MPRMHALLACPIVRRRLCTGTTMSDERIVQLKALQALQSGTWRLRTTVPLAQIQEHIGADLILTSDTIQLPESPQGSQSCSCRGSLNTDNHLPSYGRHKFSINMIRMSLRSTLLWIYLLCLLNLPKFYTSRLLMWSRNAEPLSQTCPSRNSADSCLSDLDDDPNCDLEFCRRVLTTFLREWKTLRIFSTVLFASILAILQISRVESDLLIGFPIYLALICGMMAAVYAAVLDLYFQSGKSSPNTLAWINSLRTVPSPRRFNEDSVVLAIPAISTTWCTVLFVLSITTFAFRAYTDQNAPSAAEDNTAASSAFRLVFSVFTGIHIIFLVMLFATLRRISKGYVLTERSSRSEITSRVR